MFTLLHIYIAQQLINAPLKTVVVSSQSPSSVAHVATVPLPLIQRL